MHNRVVSKRTADIREILFLREGHYSKDFKESGYFAKEYEIIYVKSGSLLATLNGKVFLMCKNSMLFVSPGNFVRLGNDNSDADIINCSFRGYIHCRNFEAGGIYEINELQERYLTNAVQLFSHTEEKAAELLRLNLEMLITILSDAVAFLKTDELNSHTAECYERIFEYLYSNTAKKAELSEIAKETGLSEANLKYIVYKYAGVGVLKLFNILKVMKSLDMAKQIRDTSVIARSLGFKDAAYFRKLFFATTGIKIKDYINGVNNEGNL